jgi:hypothetical protein
MTADMTEPSVFDVAQQAQRLRRRAPARATI